MRTTETRFCDDCPDHEACASGWSCDAVQLVHRTCAEQGVPVKVTDPTTLRKIATLLTGKAPE